jgi:hypothetical protein
MKRFLSRRNFIQSGALMATACAASGATQSFAQALPETGKPLPIKLGICSYTFRNFTRAQMLGYLKDLRLADLNVKDTKDHLPMDPTLEAQALADYAAAGIELHAAGTIYFPSSGESDIRGKFEYCKRAGIDSSGLSASSRNTTSRSPSTIMARKTSTFRRRLTCSKPSKTSIPASASAST